MSKKDIGFDFLNSDDAGFIREDEDGDSYKYSDGSGYYHGSDGSEGYIYSDGSGYFHGADGSDGYIYSDGSGYYHGADGSDGYKYSDGSGYFHGADGSDGYRYSDGSGYYNSSDGDNYSFDEYDNDDDDDDEDSSDVSLGAAAIGTLIGLGLAAYSSSKEKREEERREEERRLAEERRKEEERQRIRDEKARARRKKRFAFYKRHWKGILIFFAILAASGFLGYKYWEYTQSVEIGISSEAVVGMNYKEVESLLEESGFNDVYAYSRADLDYSDKDDENKVVEVSIDGNTQFSSADRYPNYSHVEIVYHTLKDASTPVSAKDAKGMDYKELAGLFKDAGFVNVSYEKDADLITGWITKENSVKSISIDGDSEFSEDAPYKIDAEIVITYHTFK